MDLGLNGRTKRVEAYQLEAGEAQQDKDDCDGQSCAYRSAKLLLALESERDRSPVNV